MQSESPNLRALNSYDTAEFSADSSHAYVVELCPDEKHILELGAGSGVISKVISDTKGGVVTAVDINPSPMLRDRVANVLQADLNNPEWVKIFSVEDKFDVIIAADVLEHLYDPWTTLRQMKNLLNKGGEIIVSLPHASHAGILAALLCDDVSYKEWGLLDKTHIRFFGLKNIISLHNEVGLKIIDARIICKTPEETELRDFWADLPFNQKKAICDHRHGLIYQVVVKSVDECEDIQSSIDLLHMPILIDYPEYLNDRHKYMLRKYSELICSLAKFFALFKSSKLARDISEKLILKGNETYQRTK